MFSVTQFGKELDNSKYTWNEENKVFSTKESNLVLDFSDYISVAFHTGFFCTFKTSHYCTFETLDNCVFYTGDCCKFLSLKLPISTFPPAGMLDRRHVSPLMESRVPSSFSNPWTNPLSCKGI
jgi:hypothetical protein